MGRFKCCGGGRFVVEQCKQLAPVRRRLLRLVVARQIIRKPGPGPIPDSPADPVIAYVRADLHVEAVEGPAGGGNGNIILRAHADDAGLVARDAITVINVPNLGGEGVFEVGIRKAG